MGCKNGPIVPGAEFFSGLTRITRGRAWRAVSTDEHISAGVAGM